MKKLKQIIASLLAVSSMALCATGISANAASSGSWSLSYTPGSPNNNSTKYITINSSNNYYAYISTLTNGGTLRISASVFGYSGTYTTTGGKNISGDNPSSHTTTTFTTSLSGSKSCTSTGSIRQN